MEIPEQNKSPQGRYDIEPGWEKIIKELIDKLNLIDPAHKIFQIKEKFGGLRYYADFSENVDFLKVQNIITEYEEISEHTCQDCGFEGQRYELGRWIITLCADCKKKREDEKKKPNVG